VISNTLVGCWMAGCLSRVLGTGNYDSIYWRRTLTGVGIDSIYHTNRESPLETKYSRGSQSHTGEVKLLVSLPDQRSQRRHCGLPAVTGRRHQDRRNSTPFWKTLAKCAPRIERIFLTKQFGIFSSVDLHRTHRRLARTLIGRRSSSSSVSEWCLLWRASAS
jgi:hypothetical protein